MSIIQSIWDALLMTPQYGTVNIVLEFVGEEITLSGIIY